MSQLLSYIGLGILLLFMLLLAFMNDRANQHPYLGLGSEQTKIEHGAEWETCPDCNGETAVYKKSQSGLPPGASTRGTTCGNCGATISWNPEKNEVMLISSGDENEPYSWR